MEEVILKVSNLNVELDGDKIIKNLSVDIEKGDIWVILGPNGAGKTVFLRTLLGVLPYRGKIEWKKKVKIDYVPQRLPMIKELPINVKEFFELKKATYREIINILNSVGMKEDILRKKMGDLSFGQFQRILIAWGLVDNPDVLLFDEPFAGVDVSGTESIYDLIERMHKERKLVILLVSHDLNIVYKFAKNVLCINKKQICYGKPKKVLNPKMLTELYGGGIKFYSHEHD